MRSIPTIVALVLAGSFDLVAASVCKPSGPVQSSTESKTAPPSTTTDGPIVVTNAVANGDFGGYDPSADGGIYAFEAGGAAKLLQGAGLQGDHSQESNCVQLRTQNQNSGPVKRDTPPENSYIQQKLEQMEPSDYTVRFWYVVLNNAVADTCRVEGFYGGDLFGATPYFPVVSDGVGDQWKEFIDSMPVTTTSGMVRFELSCVNGGSAEVYFDQVFVSNQVSPDNMDNISLFFPTSKHAATLPPDRTSTLQSVDTPMTTSDKAEASATETSPAGSYTSETTARISARTSDATSDSTTTSAVSPTDTVTPDGKKVCAKLVPGAPGRGCAKRPYNSSRGYKNYPAGSITKEQCAALCLVDGQCQSFEWTYRGSDCANSCTLIAALWADVGTNGASDAAWAYDRTCIEETECADQPDGTVCVNVNADTPAKSCTKLMGKAKSCAKPFLTVGTRSYCGLGSECRDLCAKYPSCKSYGATFGSCSLYDARSSEVAVAGSDLFWFTDMDCHACGEGNAHFNYVTPLQDPVNMPAWSCDAEPTKLPSAMATSSIANTVSIIASSAETHETTSGVEASDTNSSLPPPSTTLTSVPSSTNDNCPQGIASPGACFRASPTPGTSTCWKNGQPLGIDAYGFSLNDHPNQNTVEDCALICKLDPMCKAFGFDATRPRMRCVFSPELMEDASLVEDASNPIVWNDMKCMNCMMCGEKATPSTTKAASPPELTCAAINNGRGCRYKNNEEFPTGPNGRPIKPYVCMSNGKVTNEEPWSATGSWPFQSSMEKCVGICAQLPNCKASAWNRATNRCQFVSSSLQEAGYRGVEGSEVFWSDNACWDCSSLCHDNSGEHGTETTSGPLPTEPLTTMMTSTRSASDDGESASTTEAATSTTDDSEEGSTSKTPTTTQKTPQAEPTDCSVPTATLSDDATCGLPGSAGNQVQTYRLQNFIIKPVGSLGACASLCLQREDCQSSEYDKQSTVCYLYRTGPAGLGLTYTPSSTHRFYDRGCFKCAS
ncbi:hypothetical protein FZEAL_6075 [Fusarium zealandicum]|uniref:Apple domain-containing protein n=1 Tax=Fusarium zealandicum TaxID=1053134 RepID=A0A8H4UJ75_9HYPO|nr:hypothetical protein FZEAL_6075 [Fusarium zealandicum]